ncbi:hypothetical protein CCACVL1_02557 [Corchorus capsularis]|uniref:Endonuclease/exonuclease/phosphatase n=1 Tax=Corchorus capsularis TaxID=210143 RepID=A0A1R3K7P2_COCAP|nr:hypothetical protein CCACVL1_02557 [Corchorus capsularis]
MYNPTPPKDRLPLPAKKLIETLESQLSIAYPDTGLEESQEVRQKPILRSVVGLIVASAQQIPHLGRPIQAILRNWLHLNHTDIPRGQAAARLLEDRAILKQLYSRGLANKYPPVLCLQTTDQDIKMMEAGHGITEVVVEGIKDYIGLLDTVSTSKVWLSANFHVGRASAYASAHIIQVMPDNSGVNFPNIECLDYAQFCLQQRPSPLHPLRVLILNARGANNPEFILTFVELTYDYNPDVFIVTEKRPTGEENLRARNSMGYTGYVSVDAIGYFGGLWFLWDQRKLRFRLISRSRNSITLDITFLNRT